MIRSVCATITISYSLGSGAGSLCNVACRSLEIHKLSHTLEFLRIPSGQVAGGTCTLSPDGRLVSGNILPRTSASSTQIVNGMPRFGRTCPPLTPFGDRSGAIVRRGGECPDLHPAVYVPADQP